MTSAATTSTTDPLAEFGDAVQRDYPLARHTWFRIGGPARYFVQPTSVEQLQAVAKRCVEADLPVYVLGLGANLLVSSEGVPGVVIKLSSEAFREVSIRRDNDLAALTVGAGADMQKLLLKTCREGLAGIECMAGIPGTVGGAVKMNAGCYGSYTADVVERVTVMD
ncbi:MAG: FAD-binding protein, partial [Planctomycetota bacterium]